jgi:phosphate uptake regulator
METRKVQKSGSTFYLYLPANWCKSNGIKNDTQLSLETSSDGKLIVSSKQENENEKELSLRISEDNGKIDSRVVNMFIVASYLNPIKSFKIKLGKPLSSLDILDQKRLMSNIELVEFGEDRISCESTISVDDPDILLKIMIRKMVNMTRVIQTNEAKELVDHYEEEIDRSNTLIQKAAISSLMFKRSSKLRHIELFYIAILSKNLEGLADQLFSSTGNRNSKKIAKEVQNILLNILKCIDTLDYGSASSFVNDVLKSTDKMTEKDSCTVRIKALLHHISETLIDWTVTKEVDTPANISKEQAITA